MEEAYAIGGLEYKRVNIVFLCCLYVIKTIVR